MKSNAVSCSDLVSHLDRQPQSFRHDEPTWRRWELSAGGQKQPADTIVGNPPPLPQRSHTASAPPLTVPPATSIEYLPHLCREIPAVGPRRIEALAQRVCGSPVAELSNLDASALSDTLKAIKVEKPDAQRVPEVTGD